MVEDVRSLTAAPPGLEPGGRGAFTLVELLVVIAILAILAVVLIPALNRSLDGGRSARCGSNLRQIAVAVHLFADDHEDAFPRSQHSASAYNEVPWERSIASRLGATDKTWKTLLRGVYHCGSDRRVNLLSYGLNVYFELGPQDDYAGKPRTWRRRTDLPRPAATILLAENASLADHIMPNFWTRPEDAEDLDSSRHVGRANYAFTDGHVGTRALLDVYAPDRSVDAWNPLTASD